MKASPIAFGTYNPSQVPKVTLLAEFTARRELLSDLIGILRSNASGEPCQHSLLIGPRGFGKTTSLFALKYRLEDDEKLAAEWVPLLFDEENYQIADLAGFWLECLRLGEFAFQVLSPRYAELSVSRDPTLESIALEAFLSLLDQQGRRALLLIDNINDILSVVSDESEQHRLRAFLLEDSRVCVIGTASTYFEAIQNTDQPLYNLFRTFRLDRFSPAEMRGAVEAMAKARSLGNEGITLPMSDGYWTGLHILTGGNPRLVKIVFQLMERGVTPDFRVQLEGLLDTYTPYFKHRIEAMSPQQRRVFDAIALAWDPIQISDIAPGLRMDSNQISAQIRSLTDAQLVAIAGGTSTRRSYQIADRFSNIYYFMRYSRAGRAKFEWFVLTMKAILTPEQFRSQLDRMRKFGLACDNDSELRDQAHLLASATHALDDPRIRRAEAHKSVAAFLTHSQENALNHLLDDPEMREVLGDEHAAVRFFAALPRPQSESINYQPDDGDWWDELATSAEARELWPLAEAAYRKAIELEPCEAFYWSCFGDLLADHLDRLDEAEAAHRKAIELESSDAYSWCRLGIFLSDHLGHFDEAEAVYRKAIEIEPSYAFAWNNLGILLADHFGRFTEAEAAHRKAIELEPSRAYPWCCLGEILEGCSRFAEAESAFQKATELEPSYAYGWANLGMLFYRHLRRFHEAELAFRKAIEFNGSSATLWNSLGCLLAEQFQRFDEAEAAFKKAVEIAPSAASSWHNLGALYSEYLQRFPEGETAYRKAIGLDPSEGVPKAGFAKLLAKLGSRSSEAIDLATEAILTAPEAPWVRQVFREIALTVPLSAARVLNHLAESLSQGHPDMTSEDTGADMYALALDCIATLIGAGLEDKALESINRPKTRELFDVPIRAIEVRRNPNAKAKLATERLALVEAFLEKVEGPSAD